MSSYFADCLGQLLTELILRTIIYAAFIVIETQVIQRRDSIIQWGRQAQNRLHIPECMRIFTEKDPGMQVEDMRMAAEILGFACLLAFFGQIGALAIGTVWDPWVFGLVFVGPGCLLGLLWLILALSKRRLSRVPMLVGEEGHCESDILLSKEKADRQHGQRILDRMSNRNWTG